MEPSGLKEPSLSRSPADVEIFNHAIDQLAHVNFRSIDFEQLRNYVNEQRRSNQPLSIDPEYFNVIKLDMQETLEALAEYNRGLLAADQLIAFAEEIGIQLEVNKIIALSLQNDFVRKAVAMIPELPETLIAFAEKYGIALDYSRAIAEALRNGNTIFAQEAMKVATQHETVDISAANINEACNEGLVKLLSAGYIEQAEELVDFSREQTVNLDMQSDEVKLACQKGVNAVLTTKDYRVEKKEEIGKLKAFCAKHNMVVDFYPAFQETATHFVSAGELGEVMKVAAIAEKNGNTVLFNTAEMPEAFQYGLAKEIFSSEYASNFVAPEKYIDFATEHNIPLNFNTPEVQEACQKAILAMLRIHEGTDVDKKRKTTSAKVMDFINRHNIAVDVAPAYTDALAYFSVHSNYTDPQVILDLAKERGITIDIELANQRAEKKRKYFAQFHSPNYDTIEESETLKTVPETVPASNSNESTATNYAENSLEFAIVRYLMEAMSSKSYISGSAHNRPYKNDEILRAAAKNFNVPDDNNLFKLFQLAQQVNDGRMPNTFKTAEESAQTAEKERISHKLLEIRSQLRTTSNPGEELDLLKESLSLAAQRGYLYDPDPLYDSLVVRELSTRIQELQKELDKK